MALSRAFAFWTVGSFSFCTLARAAAFGSVAACSVAFGALAFCSAGFEQDDRPRPMIKAKAAPDARTVRGLFALRIMYIEAPLCPFPEELIPRCEHMEAVQWAGQSGEVPNTRQVGVRDRTLAEET